VNIRNIRTRPFHPVPNCRGFKVVVGSDVMATDDQELHEAELKTLRRGFEATDLQRQRERGSFRKHTNDPYDNLSMLD